jgi:hypothetical protein
MWLCHLVISAPIIFGVRTEESVLHNIMFVGCNRTLRFSSLIREEVPRTTIISRTRRKKTKSEEVFGSPLRGRQHEMLTRIDVAELRNV